jgi:hypothetical protein
LQPNSDPYFHTKSFDEIVTFTTVGNGNTCAVATSTGNNPPTVNAGQTYTIPMQTPFALTGSASDPNGDALTYDWEQFDLGAAAPPNTDDGTRPIFRVFNPKPIGTRIFPKLSDILSNTITFGESLPTTTRSLTFRLMARDNKAGGGGTDYATVVLKVSNQAGPFAITSSNAPYTWPALSMQNVSWNVANTNAAPVNCANIDLRLSYDGGATFPVTLASATPNDGAEAIALPITTTNQARLNAQCSTSIFFDISNANGTIIPPQYLLSVNLPITNAGIITSTPTGIACPNDCSESFNPGTVVTLTATPQINWTFAGWAGGCTGSGACVVTMDQSVAVTPTFILDQHLLRVTFTGNGVGSVSSTPAGIDCPGDCEELLDSGSVITLTAAADNLSTFIGWDGGCTGTADCVVLMDQAKNVIANFYRSSSYLPLIIRQ